MKRIISVLLIAAASISLTSCDYNRELGEDDGDRLIIEPPCEPMFRFDDDGIPYRWGMPELTAEMQPTIRAELIGYGWKWMQTNEIYSSGFIDHEDFYESMIGMSPSSYYLKSDDELIRYFHSDACNKDAYLTHQYSFDAKTGVLSNGAAPLGILPWTFYLKIVSFFQYVNDRWYLVCVEPLCMRSGAEGESHIVWGVSQYVRMSASELQQMQRQYDFDYSQVN